MIHKTLPSLLPLILLGTVFGSSAVAADDGGGKASGSETSSAHAEETAEDPWLWLEEIDGERAMEWVHAQNAETAERLETLPLFPELLEQAKEALGNESRIPSFTLRGEYLYELWRDEDHPRGLYRRMKVSDVAKENPTWETVLDVDALGAKEGVTWVFKGLSCLGPENRHCLARLSPGGGDAVEVREFDMETMSFVTDGFHLATAKSRVDWIDHDHLFVGPDLGPDSLTESGYPRTVRRWKRGTPIEEAVTLFEAPAEAVAATGSHHEGDEDYPDVDLIHEATSFWTSTVYLVQGDELVELALPESARIQGVWRGRLLVSPQEDWVLRDETFARGSLLLVDTGALYGEGKGDVDVLFEPTSQVVLEGVSVLDRGVLVTLLDHVEGRLRRYEPDGEGGFRARDIEFPAHGSLSVTTVDRESGDAFVLYESFVTPRTLYLVSGETAKATEIRSQTPTFDPSGIEVNQYWTESNDGTKVPYFVVAKKDLPRNGKNPAHIFSYGGFRNALTPSYSGSYEELYGAYGQMWLERGGVFVLANIRGGGEFGPDWHRAALRENRHRSFEDFEAVARDLEARKITSPKHLGIEGRSNGGLLVTATFTRHPELYGAVICGVPLADMKRYHRLLAGASWMAEYGDPDVPEDWEFMKKYSPYQNLEKDQDYPAVLYYTSTRDDRVHPGHARKMAAKMIDLGYEVWYYENTEGGHGGSTTNDQLAYRLALAYAHLWNQLGPDEPMEPVEPIRPHG